MLISDWMWNISIGLWEKMSFYKYVFYRFNVLYDKLGALTDSIGFVFIVFFVLGGVILIFNPIVYFSSRTLKLPTLNNILAIRK